MSLAKMTHSKWEKLSEAERKKLRSDAGLTPQLIGLEGWRVEVEDIDGTLRRFNVGRSTGWIPCHIELARIDSNGGGGCQLEYTSIRKIRKVRDYS